MAGVLSIGRGYDPGYLTKSVGAGAENYYLSAVREHGEPPGYWSGKGAEALGLAPGSQVDSQVMEALYGEFWDIRDPRVLDKSVPDSDKPRLGRKPATYTSAEELFQRKVAAEPEATEERREELRIQAQGEARKALQFLDLTFSPSKSYTLTHAGLLATARRAEEAGNAEQAQAARSAATRMEEILKEAAATGVEEARQAASFARVGYHGKKIDGSSTGRWAPAGDWVVASFFQHTSRNGDPQLHVHQAVLNRQLCADGVWRSLDGQAVFRARAQAAAVSERTLMERSAAELGIRWVQRPDGNGWEIEGVSPEQVAEFSTRRVEVNDRVAELVAAYEAKHGHAPSPRTLFGLAQQATRDTKTAKPKADRVPSQAEELQGWEERTTRAEIDALASIPGKALFQLGEEEREQLRQEVAELDVDRVVAAAIADAQRDKAVFSEYELTRHLSRHLPACFGGLGAEQVRTLLLGIRDEALAPDGRQGPRVLDLSVPDVVDIPDQLRHADGRSVFRDPSLSRWTTPEELRVEERFTRAAAQRDAPAAPAAELAARLGYAPPTEHGSAADVEHAAVEHGSSEPGRDASADEAVSGPAAEAGSGAERGGSAVDAERAGADRDGSAAERESYAYGLASDQVAAVYGIATSGRRIDVLEGYAGTGKSYTVARLADVWRETTSSQVIGLTTAQNAAHVLKGEGLDTAWNITRWLKNGSGLRPGQLVVVDEASMVTNDHLTRIQQLAEEAGAKILLTGDSEQLSAPGAGGLMRHLVTEQGAARLTEVRRFRNEWEREASVALRAGDEEVLATYDQHGRLRGGTREEMQAGARDAFVADHLQGKRSLLLAATNPEAVEMAGMVREELVRLGAVSDERAFTLRDGNRAGAGDLITARHNEQAIRVRIGDEERELTNRDVLQVGQVAPDGTIQARLLGGDGRPAPGADVALEPRYAKRHVELAYAGTAHAAQGRTVDTSHALVSEGMDRQMLYVELSRGREGNWAWTITERENEADLRPQRSAADGPRAGADREPSAADPAIEATGPAAGSPSPEALSAGGGEPAAAAGALHGGSAAEAERAAVDGPGSGASREAVGVLAGVLANDQADATAIEAMRTEARRVTHMAHLGSMWTSVVQDAVADRTTAELQRLLPAEVHARLEEDPARGAVITAVRQAVLAGHDLDRVLSSATAEGWERARSIGQVLSGRIQRIIGTGEAAPDQTWLQRTPRLPDTKLDTFAREVAQRMDEQVEHLGEQAASRPPSWLTERLGPVPEEAMARTEWQRRAGLVCAYREQYGNEADERTVLGAAPDRHSPEQRAAWQAANAALGRTREEREIAEAGDGQLWVWRERYVRAAAWAPPHVGEELKAARIERDDREREAVRLAAEARAATDEAERSWLRTRLDSATALAAAAGERIGQLETVERARSAWHQASEADRTAAQRADAELHRRHGSLDLPPLHRGAEAPTEEATRPEAADPRDEVVPGQTELFAEQPGERALAAAAPEPEREPVTRGGDEAHQQELDLGLAEAPAAADAHLRSALEAAQQAHHILQRRDDRQAAAVEGREAGQEPTIEERRRDERYREDFTRREEAELQRRQAQHAPPAARRAPVERQGPELSL